MNIGANKDSTDRISDYVAGINAFSDWRVISPSTFHRPIPRAAQFAVRRGIAALLKHLNEARSPAAESPMLLKLHLTLKRTSCRPSPNAA